MLQVRIHLSKLKDGKAGKIYTVFGLLLLQICTSTHAHTRQQMAAVLSRHKWRPRPPSATRARDGLQIDFQYASSSLSNGGTVNPPSFSSPAPALLSKSHRPSLRRCSLTNSSLSSSHAGSRLPPLPFAPPSSLFSFSHPSYKPNASLGSNLLMPPLFSLPLTSLTVFFF